MQPVALVQEGPPPRPPPAVSRVQDNVLARRERDVLDWLCLHMPRAVTPDRLTMLGAGGAAVVFAGYAATYLDPAFLWLATLGIVIHWLGDSLDGSLARYRRIDRPRYGYFLDHSVDALCNLLIMTGAGLSVYIRLDVALFALLGYFMLCMYVFLYNHVSLRFQLSFLALGPTELRVGLIGINCWMYFAGDSKIAIGGEIFSPYDLVLCGVGIVFVGLFAGNVFAAARELRRADASPGRLAGGDSGKPCTLRPELITVPPLNTYSRFWIRVANESQSGFHWNGRLPSYRRARFAARRMSGKKSA